jgi:hypothetical protein
MTRYLAVPSVRGTTFGSLGATLSIEDAPCLTEAEGLGNAAIGIGLIVISFLMLIIQQMHAGFENMRSAQETPPACDVTNPKYDFEKCQKYRTAKEAANNLLAGGVVDNANAQRAVDRLRQGGIDLSGIDLSFLESSFSFSVDDILGALSSVPSSLRPGNMTDAELSATVMSLVPGDRYDAPPPVDGGSGTATTTGQTVVLVALVGLLGYAAYKYL